MHYYHILLICEGDLGVDETQGREDHERVHCSGGKEIRGGHECGTAPTHR